MRQVRWVVLLAWGCGGKPVPADPVAIDVESDADSDVGPVDADADGFVASLDCDDQDAASYPGAPDICGDDRVTDCDRVSDDGLVTVDGTDTFEHLQSALDAAAAGSTVLVCPGTWFGVSTAAVPVDLRSHRGPETTILDGDNGGTVLSVPGGSAVTGLTIRDGRTQGSGGGVLLATSGTLAIDGCTIISNRAQIGGGVAVPSDSMVTIVASSLESNQADGEGGGLSVGAGSTVDLTDSLVHSNTADGQGGGVFLDGAGLVGGTVQWNTIIDWTSPGFRAGGGVAMVGAATISGTEIQFNEAQSGGGFSVGNGTATLTDVSVHDNHERLIPQGVVTGYGGGGYTWLAELVLAGTTEVFRNHATYGGGVYLNQTTLTGGIVRENAADVDGGGVGLHNAAMVDTVVRGNTAGDSGGGAECFGGSITGGLVAGNHARKPCRPRV